MNDILFKIVYLAQDQFETYTHAIKESNLPKSIQWDLTALLKEVREHTEMARQIGWIRD